MTAARGTRGRRPGPALGLDLGSRRVGIARTDAAGRLALPRATFERTGDPEDDRRRLAAMVVEEGVVTLVIGLPVSLDGSEGPAAVAARAEAEALQTLLAGSGVEVELFDERLTTVSAHRALAAGGLDERRRRGVVDQSAAAVMLSAWLDAGPTR